MSNKPNNKSTYIDQDGSDNIGLYRWLAKEKAEIAAHAEKMIIKAANEDQVYLGMISKSIKSGKCKEKEAILLLSFLRHKDDGKLFSVNQRSVIAAIYYKHVKFAV